MVEQISFERYKMFLFSMFSKYPPFLVVDCLDNYRYYETVSIQKYSTIVVIVTKVFGDPDVYLAFDNEFPSEKQYQFRGSTAGSERVVISSTDPKNTGGVLFIAVKGFQEATEYKISISAEKDCSRQHICSGHGSCTKDMVCSCDELWNGEFCDQMKCPNDCTGRGACKLIGGIPSCECVSGYEGPACDKQIDVPIKDIEVDVSSPSSVDLVSIPQGQAQFIIVKLSNVLHKKLVISAINKGSLGSLQLYASFEGKPTHTSHFAVGKEVDGAFMVSH